MVSITYPVNGFRSDPYFDKLDEIPVLLSFSQGTDLFNDMLRHILDLQILIKFPVYRVFTLYIQKF